MLLALQPLLRPLSRARLRWWAAKTIQPTSQVTTTAAAAVVAAVAMIEKKIFRWGNKQRRKTRKGNRYVDFFKWLHKELHGGLVVHAPHECRAVAAVARHLGDLRPDGQHVLVAHECAQALSAHAEQHAVRCGQPERGAAAL